MKEAANLSGFWTSTKTNKARHVDLIESRKRSKSLILFISDIEGRDQGKGLIWRTQSWMGGGGGRELAMDVRDPDEMVKNEEDEEADEEETGGG